MNQMVKNILFMLLVIGASVGIGIGYYMAGLQGWVRNWRLPSYRRLMAWLFGVIAFLAGTSIVFLGQLETFLSGLGLKGSTSMIALIVMAFWIVVAVIAWIIVLSTSKDSIEH